VSGKVRVYELVKETGLENDEVIRRLRLLGVEVKGHLSSISEGDAARLRDPVGGSEPARDDAVVGSELGQAALSAPLKALAVQVEALTERIQELESGRSSGAVDPPLPAVPAWAEVLQPYPGRQPVTPQAFVSRRVAAGLFVVGLALGAAFVGLIGNGSDQSPELLAATDPEANTSPPVEAGEDDPDVAMSPEADRSDATTPPGTDGESDSDAATAQRADGEDAGSATSPDTADDLQGAIQGSNGVIADAVIVCTWDGVDGILGTEDDVRFTDTVDAEGAYAIEGLPYGSYACVATDPASGDTVQFSAEIDSVESGRT
jgi:hypothetical protein